MKVKSTQSTITITAIIAVIGLCVLTSACISDTGGTANSADATNTTGIHQTEHLLVAVSILPQKEFVQSIGGENVDIIVLIPPGASPATYAPTTGQMIEISKARAYFKVGSPLPFEETYLNKLISANPEMAITDCSKGIAIKNNDPHIWNSPANAVIMCRNIADGLSEIDLDNAGEYKQNLKEYTTSLNELDKNIKNILNKTENRKFMILHPAWGYFADDYDLEQIPVEVEGKEPGAKQMAELITFAKSEDITRIFANPQMNSESARVIAEQIGGEVVYADPLAPDYHSNLLSVAKKIAQAE